MCHFVELRDDILHVLDENNQREHEDIASLINIIMDTFVNHMYKNFEAHDGLILLRNSITCPKLLVCDWRTTSQAAVKLIFFTSLKMNFNFQATTVHSRSRFVLRRWLTHLDVTQM